MADDFDSSDDEDVIAAFVSKHTHRQHYGMQTIDKIIDSAVDNRTISKLAHKTLDFASGAPHTQDNQHRWMNYFDNVRAGTFGEDLNVAPSGETVFRCALGIRDRLNKRDRDDDKPSFRYLKSGMKIVRDYCEHTYGADFVYNSQDKLKLATLLDDLVRQGLLFRGRRKPTQRIRNAVMVELTRRWYKYAIKKTHGLWDLNIAKALSICSMLVGGLRSGDVARVHGYDDSHSMKYRDVDLRLSTVRGDGSLYKDIICEITVRYGKHEKVSAGENHYIRLRPLADPMQHTACFIATLLIQALRHGLVRGGPHLPDVLRLAAQRPDKKIEWLFPDYPITCLFTSRDRLNLQRPAGASQLVRTVKHTGLVAGILQPLRSHSIRRGYARDVAALTVPLRGATTAQVGQVLQHHPQAQARGTTRKYTKGITEDLPNKIARVSYQPTKADVTFANTTAVYKPRVTSLAEIDQYCDTHGLWKTYSAHRTKARNAIIKAEKDEFLKNATSLRAQPVQLTPSLSSQQTMTTTARPPLQPWSGSAVNTGVRDSSNPGHPAIAAAQVEARPAALDFSQLDPRLQAPHDAAGNRSQPTREEQRALQDQDDSEDFENAEVDSTSLQDLCSRLTDSTDIQIGPSIFSSADAVPALVTLNPPTERHTAATSPYNLIRQTSFAGARPSPEIAHSSVAGGSRDAPTPFMYPCTKGRCEFQHRDLYRLEHHRIRCTGLAPSEEEKAAEFQCRFEDCSRMFTTEILRTYHEDEEHDVPETCPECTDGELYTRRQLADHQHQMHTRICEDEIETLDFATNEEADPALAILRLPTEQYISAMSRYGARPPPARPIVWHGSPMGVLC